MRSDITSHPISEEEARSTGQALLAWMSSQEKFIRDFGYSFDDFKVAFTEVKSKDKFKADPQRAYYLVFNKSRKEALFGINFNPTRDRSLVNLSSFARIIKKDGAAPGWRYLEEMIEGQLFQRPEIKKIYARLKTPGGVKAFENLKLEFRGDYTVDVEKDSKYTARVWVTKLN